ncbi:hypothetical protein RJT34_08024 [Clitoria ternatea]|uniref:TF-B3 domain-containing protein n=1 Tax=Clitoria ternatea TaxID=43366 RepID=A0AAN9PUB2_CLITE
MVEKKTLEIQFKLCSQVLTIWLVGGVSLFSGFKIKASSSFALTPLSTVKVCTFFNMLEMGLRNCNGCRSLEEDIYWTRFQFQHFVQFLRTGFDQHFALPKTFSDNLKKKLPENVSLKGPSGVVWNIGLTTRDDTLYFTNGWQQFAKDQSLRENDFLVFKYNGESQFDVLIFDGGSFCEKAGSYFVRKCGHAEDVSGCVTKKRDTDNSVEEDNTPSLNPDVECASRDKSGHVNGVKEPVIAPAETPYEKTFMAGLESASPEQHTPNGVPDPKSVPSKSTGRRSRSLVSAVKHIQTKRRGRPPKPSSLRDRALNWVTDCEPASAGKSGSFDSYISNRRPVTDDETKRALQLAQAACASDSYLVVMRPTHVYRRFFMAIPTKWMADHISVTSQDVILRMGKGEWVAKYSFHAIRNTGGLTGGWKHFTLDNNLEEYDVCVFKPAGHMNNTLVLDVSIFRVVEEIVPLTAIGSPAKRSRKQVGKPIETES